MYYNKVEICGINTSKLTVLKEKEKIELLKKIRQGDQKARQEMINGNLRLVLSVVQKFTNRGENLDDLFQVGCIGLIKAIDNFDPNQNVRFSTYGVPMIIGEIRRHLRDNNSVRVSRSLRDLAYKAMQAKEAFLSGLHLAVGVGGLLTLLVGIVAWLWLPRSAPGVLRHRARRDAAVMARPVPRRSIVAQGPWTAMWTKVAGAQAQRT